MSDPLSISAGIVGLLQAVKSLYGFIDSIKDAPEILTRAGDDLKLTDSVLEDLHRYLEASPQALPVVHVLTDQKSALNSVLPQFKKLCDDFQNKLESCVHHSAEGSKLRWTDRVMTSLKKGGIEKFQVEVSKARQLISLRVDMIALSTVEQNSAAIHDFQRRNEAAMAEVKRQLAALDITMQTLPDESSEVLERALRDQEAALKEQLRLCEENRSAADNQVRYKEEFGNIKAGDDLRNLQFLDLEKVKGSFELKYGDLEIGNRAWNAQGAFGESTVQKFFHNSAATSQPESFRGPGRRLGGNVVSLTDIRSVPTPEMKASGSDDNTVRLWDLATSEVGQTPKGPTKHEHHGIDSRAGTSSSGASDKLSAFSKPLAEPSTHTSASFEMNAINILGDLLGQNAELAPLLRKYLQRPSTDRFPNSYCRLLKSYYLQICKEASNEKERLVAQVLRKRKNRMSIAQRMVEAAKRYDQDGQEERDEGSRPLEPSHATQQSVNEWTSQQPGDLQQINADQQNIQSQKWIDYNTDNGDDDDDYDARGTMEVLTEFPGIDETMLFLQRGRAFPILVTELKLLDLPLFLREIVRAVPKTSIRIKAGNDDSLLNKVKALLEDDTGYRWDWWPLKPRIREIVPENRRLEVEYCGQLLQRELTPELAETLTKTLEDISDHPPQCHCCAWLLNSQKSFFDVVLGSLSSMVPALGRNPSPPMASKTAKYTPLHQNPGSNQTNSSSKGAPPATGGSSSTIGQGRNGQSRVSDQASQAAQTVKERWILFGVQGRQDSLEVTCIENASTIDNGGLFREIREFYCRHRGWFKRTFSPFRFQNCKSVKFQKIGGTIQSDGRESLPEDCHLGKDYEYNPRPPKQKAPLIAPEFFAVWLNECSSNCLRCCLGWHPPQCIPGGRDIVTQIPKKKSSVVFWIFWLVNNPGDWQNACVPLTTVLGLYVAIWSLHSMTKEWRN